MTTNSHPASSPAARALLLLLQIALGGATDEEMAHTILNSCTTEDWRELFRLSHTQGIAAIAADGLSQFIAASDDEEEAKEELAALYTFDLFEERVNWISSTTLREREYATYRHSLRGFCHEVSQSGTLPLILKGYGLNRDYPIPAHRAMGDIDIYLGCGESPIGPRGGDLFLKRQIEAVPTKSPLGHHSHITYQGQLIENHYELSNTYWRTKRGIALEQMLQQLAGNGYTHPEGEEFLLPSADFNAVFLLWHLSSHFASLGITLKQLIDWRQFLAHHYNEVDWTKVVPIWEAAGLKPFADAINSLLPRYLGLDYQSVPTYTDNPQLSEKVMDNIFSGIYPNDKLFKRLARYYHNDWKTRLVYGESWLRPFGRRIVMFLTHNSDIKEKEVV